MDELSGYTSGHNGVLLHLSCSEMQALLSSTLEDAMACLRLLLTAAAHHTVQGALDDFQKLGA